VSKCIDTICKMTKGGGGKCLLIYPPSLGLFSAGDLIEPQKTLFEAIVPFIDIDIYKEILVFSGAQPDEDTILHEESEDYHVGWYLRSQPADVSIPDNPFFVDLNIDKRNGDGAPKIFFRQPDNAGWLDRVERLQEELVKRFGLDSNGGSFTNPSTESRSLIVVDSRYLQPPFNKLISADILNPNGYRSIRVKNNFLWMKDEVFKQSKLDVLVLCKLKTEATGIQNGSFTKHIVTDSQQSYFFPTIEISDAEIVAWDMIKVNRLKHALDVGRFDLVTEIEASLFCTKNILEQFKRIQSQIEGKGKVFGDSSTIAHPGHFVFCGNPGTGKTVIAGMFAQYMYEIGIVESSELHVIRARDLIGKFVGGTVVKTTEFLNAGLGKVIFIDDAHQLFNGYSSINASYGKDVIKVLVPFLVNHGHDCIVIIVGYEAQIRGLMDCDIGMLNRFPNWILFDDYTEDELVEIFKKMLNRWEQNCEIISYTLSEEEEFITQLIKIFRAIKDIRGSCFSNYREARNIANKTICNLHIRVADQKLSGTESLRITLQDLPSLSDIQNALRV